MITRTMGSAAVAGQTGACVARPPAKLCAAFARYAGLPNSRPFRFASVRFSLRNSITQTNFAESAGFTLPIAALALIARSLTIAPYSIGTFPTVGCGALHGPERR